MVAISNLASLNFTQLAANAVEPAAGSNYHIQNLAFAHFLDNSNGVTSDGNPVVSGASSSASSQLWTYLDYPSTAGDRVFTLQVLSTEQSPASFNTRGGFLRIDSSTGKLVQGGAPMAWKLIEVAPTIFKLTPFDDVMSESGSLVATDMNSNIVSISANQAQLTQDETQLQQLWTFN